MKCGLNRKINLSHYGGNDYETADFWVEFDPKETTWEQAKSGIHNQIKTYLSELKAIDTKIRNKEVVRTDKLNADLN